MNTNREEHHETNRPIDPDFDGHHAESSHEPLNPSTFVDRLKWAREGTLMLEWARRVRIDSGRALPEDLERDSRLNRPEHTRVRPSRATP